MTKARKKKQKKSKKHKAQATRTRVKLDRKFNLYTFVAGAAIQEERPFPSNVTVEA
jgi:hypothetical protein